MLKDMVIRPFINIIPFSFIKQIGSQKLIIIYCHVVYDEAIPHISYLYRYKNNRQFLDDLEFLLKHYSPVGLSDVIDWVRGKKNLSSNCFLLTFDDGFREINDIIAPILTKQGIPATFFISSDFLDNQKLCYQHKASLLVDKVNRGIGRERDTEIKNILLNINISFTHASEGILKVGYKQRDILDRIAEVLQIDFQDYLNQKQPYLTSAQVESLIEQGFSIGAHSIDHPHYLTLALTEQLEQTITSIKQIREKFELTYGAFAFPHNDAGVSSEFFEKIRENDLIDITFGTGGMLDGGLRSHKQRVSLEDPLFSAREILAWQYIRKIYKQILGQRRRI